MLRKNSAICIVATLFMCVSIDSMAIVVLADKEYWWDPYSQIKNGFQDHDDGIFDVPDEDHQGKHITYCSDDFFGKNVFGFHSHVDEDTDQYSEGGKIRTEIKTYNNGKTLGKEGDTLQYRWLFKIDKNFLATNGFTHVFQIKGYGGSNDAPPVLTLSPSSRSDGVLRFQFRDQSEGVTILASTPLHKVLGEWVEVFLNAKYSKSGSVDILLTRISDSEVLLDWSQSEMQLWRDGFEFIYPKWGVYRSTESSQPMRDEVVLFDGFCVERFPNTCPSYFDSPISDPPSPRVLLLHGGIVTPVFLPEAGAICESMFES